MTTVPLYRAHGSILPGGTRTVRGAVRGLNLSQCIAPGPATATPLGSATAAAEPGPSQARRARFTLAPQPGAVREGRHAVQEILHAWKLDALADTVALLASELLTNAAEATFAAAAASGGERLALTIQHTGPVVLVEVWDPNPAQATRQDPGPADESGRGLLLVEALSSAWGQHAAGRGKIVWCEVAAEGRSLGATGRHDQETCRSY